jgi:hypothetical protein
MADIEMTSACGRDQAGGRAGVTARVQNSIYADALRPSYIILPIIRPTEYSWN